MLKKKASNTANSKKIGQRKHKCLINNCQEKGRIVARLGDILLTYCPSHRRYGLRVINYFINQGLRGKLSNFLHETRKNIFITNQPKLSKESYQTLTQYFKERIQQLYEIEKENNITINEALKENIKEEDLDIKDYVDERV